MKKLEDKNYKEIQEAINECLYECDISKLARLARELLNIIYYDEKDGIN